MAQEFLDPVKKQFPWITYADLWTLAGAQAIEEMGGMPARRHMQQLMPGCSAFMWGRGSSASAQQLGISQAPEHPATGQNAAAFVSPALPQMHVFPSLPSDAKHEPGMHKRLSLSAPRAAEGVSGAGPHIDWRPGRSDQLDGNKCPPDGRYASCT